MLDSDADKISRASASQAVFRRVCRVVRDSAFLQCVHFLQDQSIVLLAGLCIILTEWDVSEN